MSDEAVKQPDPLELIEIVPGYRETRSTKHLDKALQVFHQSIKNKGLKKSCEARVKTRTGGEFSYRYVAFSDLLNSIEESLLEASLELKQPPIQAGNTAFGVLTILSHPESGEKIVSGPFLLNNEKGGITGAGAACTSASRYSVTRLLGIALDDDEDGQQSQGSSYTQSQQRGSYQKPAAGQQSQGKKYEWSHPFPQPGFIKDHPNPNQVKILETMCEKVKKYPANVASQFGAADFASMGFKQYRDAYAAIGDEMIKKGWTNVNGIWREKQPAPAPNSPMDQFGDPEQPIFDEEVPF